VEWLKTVMERLTEHEGTALEEEEMVIEVVRRGFR